jgi:hypothetical protein
MGAKQSKKTGARKFLLNDKLEAFAASDECDGTYALADLERSTSEDRVHNSFGLPSDVLAWLVGRYLEPGDLGRLSLTCKTWRRIVLQDVVWRTMATRINNQLEEGTDPRASVLDCIRKVRPDFIWLPDRARNVELDVLKRVQDNLEIKIVFSSPSAEIFGSGKGALVSRFIQDLFVEEYGEFHHYFQHDCFLIDFYLSQQMSAPMTRTASK